MDVSDILYFSARGGEGGVRGARRGGGPFFFFFLKIAGGEGLPGEGGLEGDGARVSAGNLGGIFFFFGAEMPTKL